MIRLKKNGLSDAEVSEHLETMIKALDPVRSRPSHRAVNVSPNPADKHMLKETNKAFSKMVNGIIEDVTKIITDRM